MARHRKGLRRLLNLKPKAHAAFSALTRGRPSLARALDFFPLYGLPTGMEVLHDDKVISTIAAPRYAAELAKLSQSNREYVQTSPAVPPYPELRRVVWQAPDIYIPGRILAPIDRRLARIASFELSGPTNWSITRPRPVRSAPDHIAGRAILIPRMKHYGHLLTDMLGPIAFAVHRGLISKDNPVVVVQAQDDNPVSIAFAEGMVRMGVASRIVRLKQDDSATADLFLHAEALASSGEHRYAMPEVTALLRQIFDLAYQDQASAPPGRRRVYLTRGSAKLRQITGEEELIALLRQRDFVIFESRWDNHREQLDVFSNYDVLVGVHGAGLANVIFSKPSSRLIEIFANDARKTTGLYWASCAGADYTPVFGGPEGARQSFTIDPDALIQEIDRCLG